jgi:hypothetical protein
LGVRPIWKRITWTWLTRNEALARNAEIYLRGKALGVWKRTPLLKSYAAGLGKAGLSTKIHAAGDAPDNPVLIGSQGQHNDITLAHGLIEGSVAEATIADLLCESSVRQDHGNRWPIRHPQNETRPGDIVHKITVLRARWRRHIDNV